jgi:hypothetical protein
MMNQFTCPGGKVPPVNLPDPGGEAGGGLSSVEKSLAVPLLGAPGSGENATSFSLDRQEWPSASTPQTKSRIAYAIAAA